MAAAEDLVVLNRSEDVSATIHLYGLALAVHAISGGFLIHWINSGVPRSGATLISWRCKGEERIFVSSKSLFDNKKAIRGGIPLVFPQFGPWEHGPQHGFARISRWWLQQYPTKNANGDIEVKLVLVDNEATRAMWDYKFKLVYKVTLCDSSITTEFSVENTDIKPIAFSCLLHTYLLVPDVLQVTVSGLKGCTYVDKVKGGTEEKEQRDVVKVSENTDRVYKATPSVHDVTNTAGGSTLRLSKSNLPDTVVWNPWKEKAAQMSDFGDDDFWRMICVEAGLVSQSTVLQPKANFVASQTLSV